MVEEKIAIVYEVAGAKEFARAAQENEKALRKQALSLRTASTELQREINLLKQAKQPNQELIRAKQQLLRNQQIEIRALQDKIALTRADITATRSAASANATLSRSISGVTRVMAPLLALLSGGALVRAADNFNELNARIVNVLDSAEELPGVFEMIKRVSNETGIAIDGVTQAFVRIRPAAQDLGRSNEEIIRFSETFLKMGRLSGATAEEIRNAMTQLSQGISSGTLRGDELRSVMEQMPAVARTIAESMGIPFSEFKKAAEEGKITAEEVFTAIINKADETDAAFSKLPVTTERAFNRLKNAAFVVIGAVNELVGVTELLSKTLVDMAGAIQTAATEGNEWNGILRNLAGSVNSLIGALSGLTSLLGPITSFFEAAALGARVAALGIDSIVLSLQELKAQAQAIKADPFGFLVEGKASIGVDKKAQTEAEKQIEKLRQEFFNRNKDFFDPFGNITNPSGGVPGVITPRTPKTRDPIVPASGDKDSAKKKNDLIQAERQRIVDARDALTDALRTIDIEVEERILQLGAFADEAGKLAIRKEGAIKQNETLKQSAQEILALNLKTTEANRERQKTINDLTAAMRSSRVEVGKLSQAQEQLNDAERRSEQSDTREAKIIRLSASVKAIEASINEQRQQLKEAYDRNLITLDEFYDTEAELIAQSARAQAYALQARISLLREEQDTLRDTAADRAKNRDIANKILDLEKETAAVMEDAARAQRELTAQKEAELRETGKRLGDQVERSISQAISDALTGQGMGNTLKRFAQALRDAIVNVFADAVASQIRKMMDGVFDSIGKAVNKISGKSASGPNLSTKGKIGAGLGGILAAGGIGYGIGQASGSRLVGGIGGALGGGLAGFMAGNMIAPGIGGIIGAGLGAVVGGAAGIFGGGSAKKAQQQQQQQEAFASQISGILAGVKLSGQSDNIGSLKKDMDAVSRAARSVNDAFRTGPGGSANKAVAQQAIAQLKAQKEALKQAMRERQELIANAIKDIRQQTKELESALEISLAPEYEKAGLERELELMKLEYETKKLLEQFQDSSEARIAIMENEAAKRKMIDEGMRLSAQAAIMELQDLFQTRDDVMNANVFQRLRTQEKVKADELAGLDREIASKILEIQGQLASGVQPQDIAGLNQIMGMMSQFGGLNANLQVVINEANDPAMVRVEIDRAFDSFIKKVYGANAA